MALQSVLFGAASLASLFSAGAHAFGGGAMMARPFYRKANAAGINTHAFRYCWHFVTVMLMATAAGFAFLAQQPDQRPFAIYLTVTAFGISALSVLVSKIENAAPQKSPPAILGALIGAFGLAALFAP